MHFPNLLRLLTITDFQLNMVFPLISCGSLAFFNIILPIILVIIILVIIPIIPLPQGDDLSGVEVAQISLNIPEHVFVVLQESFHPEEEDGNQGMNVYYQVRQFLILYFNSAM